MAGSRCVDEGGTWMALTVWWDKNGINDSRSLGLLRKYLVGKSKMWSGSARAYFFCCYCCHSVGFGVPVGSAIAHVDRWSLTDDGKELHPYYIYIQYLLCRYVLPPGVRRRDYGDEHGDKVEAVN